MGLCLKRLEKVIYELDGITYSVMDGNAISIIDARFENSPITYIAQETGTLSIHLAVRITSSLQSLSDADRVKIYESLLDLTTRAGVMLLRDRVTNSLGIAMTFPCVRGFLDYTELQSDFLLVINQIRSFLEKNNDNIKQILAGVKLQ